MSRADDSTVTIRATGSGPRFLALLEAAARIDGAVVHCGRAEPRSVEAAQEELDAAHAALAPRRAAAAAAMRERTPAVAAAIEALEQGGTVQAAAETAVWSRNRVHGALLDYRGSFFALAADSLLTRGRLGQLILGQELPTLPEARAIYAALGLGGAQ